MQEQLYTCKYLRVPICAGRARRRGSSNTTPIYICTYIHVCIHIHLYVCICRIHLYIAYMYVYAECLFLQIAIYR